MGRNPFKDDRNSSVVKQKAKEWGKVKFKPTLKATKIIANDINKEKTKYPQKHVKQEEKNTCCEAATPWGIFKKELMLKQQEDQHQASELNVEGKDAKEALRQREINYRKFLMKRKKEEPVKWENFSENSHAEDKTKRKKMHKTGKHKSLMDINSKDFDSRQLTYEQNDNFRRMITKNTIMMRGTSLKHCVQNIKYHQKKQKARLES